MRRHLSLLALGALLLVAPAVRAQPSIAVLGSTGEVYQVQKGTYKSLFPNAPGGALANNPVLALDITRDGKLQRTLVPGTDGPEPERFASLAVDRNANRVWVVWEADLNYHSILWLMPWSNGTYGASYELSGDAFSTKSNPQLATTVDSYETILADGTVATTTRTILHLVWFDESAVGQRALYTAVVIDDGDSPHYNSIFDLQELAGDGPATGTASTAAPDALLRAPQVRPGRDGQSVVAGFIEPTSGALATLELRSVSGDLLSFANQARAIVIDTGRSNPGASRSAIADKARAIVIDTGHRLLRADIADYLSSRFLTEVAQSDPAVDLDAASVKARAIVIDTGVSLRHGYADKSGARVLEIGEGDDDNATSHLLDLRTALRNTLPDLPARDVRVYLSAKGDDAAVAWSIEGAVHYRETTDAGWSPVRSIDLSPALSKDDAFKLVEARTSSR